jgi:hypothetical protein
MKKEETEDRVNRTLESLRKIAESKYVPTSESVPYFKEIWINGFMSGYLQSEFERINKFDN